MLKSNRSNQLKLLYQLLKHQIRLVFKTGTVQVWIVLTFILNITLIIGLRAEGLENNVLWFLFDKELPDPIMFKSFLDMFLIIGMLFLFPVGLATWIYSLIDKSTAYYYLARPIPRKNLITGNIIGVIISYTLTLGSFLLCLWLVIGIKSGIWVSSIFSFPVILLLSSLSVYVLSVAAIIATRSIGMGLIITLAYTYYLSSFIQKYNVPVIKFLLPPVGYVIQRMGESAEPVVSLFQISYMSLVSILFLSVISIILYRKMEF